MLKIGILTLYWGANFGANLQAYATSSYLSRLGHDVIFVNYRDRFAEKNYNTTIPPVQLQAHNSFVKNHLTETPIIRNLYETRSIITDLNPDCLITGSDAVFRLMRNASRSDQVFPNPFWLPFPKNEKNGIPIKVALSPSAMGCRFDRLPQSVQNGINQSISEMDYVSVRDEWTAQQLKKTGIQRQVPVMPDPVFLLCDEIAQRKKSVPNRDPYILVSCNQTMSTGWMTTFTKLANKKGFEVISLPLPHGKWDAPVNRKIEFPIDPLKWMDWIGNASGYVGVRFHPIVVSLISNVPFVSIDRYHRAFWEANRSKTFNLLKTYNLQEYAYSQLGQRFLSPRKVLELLEAQKEISGRISDISSNLRSKLKKFLAKIFQSEI